MSTPRSTTTRGHGDTEAPLTGLDAVLHDLFDWIQDNARVLAIVLGALLLLSLIAVGIYEMRRSARAAAQTRLLQIELGYTQAMGAMPGALAVAEPANEEVARRARETALAQLDALIAEDAGTDAAILATIRAAEMEVDLGRLEAADARLEALAGTLDDDDPRRSIALRLRAYTLEERGRYVDAGEAYTEAAQNPDFPPRALAFLSAAENFERAGATARAITAYEQVLSSSAEVAQGEGVLARMQALEARTPATPPPPPAESPGS